MTETNKFKLVTTLENELEFSDEIVQHRSQKHKVNLL